MARVYNFSAGPSMLPEAVLKTAQAELLDYHGSGMSVMEMSHRSKWFDEIITNTEAAMRRVLNIPDNYKVGFFQGGATQQFAMVPLNFMKTGTADYLVTGNFSKKGYAYTGALRILKVILSYDYLWLNVRVKGGAYGCMSGFTRSGDSYFSSYRDPNLRKTNEIFEKTTEYLKNFTVDERDMTKYIIGTVSELDTPLTPSIKGQRAASAYLCGMTEEAEQKERDEVIGATQEDIRKLAGIVEAVLSDDCLCVIGSEEALTKEQDLFAHLEELY